MLGDNRWSTWLIALIIGVPTVGYAYYYLSSKRDSKKLKPNKVTNSSQPQLNSTANQTNLTNSNSRPVNQSPLERALILKENGNKMYKEGKYNDAVKCYSEALDICPNDEPDHKATLYQNRAAAYEALGNLEKVISNCTDAIKLKPLYMKALSRRCKACEKLGQLRQSLEDITTCCYLQKFSNEDDIVTADRILKKFGLEEAEKYMKTKPLVMPSQEFIEHCLSSLANDPLNDFLTAKNSTSEVNLRGIEAAKVALRKGNYEKVLSSCNEEIDSVKESSKPVSDAYYQALLLRGTLYVLMNESVRAKADLENIINSSDADVRLVISALLKRACIFMQSERVDEAFSDFDMAEKLSPNADIYHQKAQMLLLSDKAKEAIVEFEKAYNLNPDFGLIQIQKAFTEYKVAVEQMDKKRAFLAKQVLRDLVNKNPKLIEGYLLLVQIYNELQEFDQSEALMNEAIKAIPTNATIHVHRGLLYFQWKGDFDLATKDIQKAIDLDPKCGYAYETYATLEVSRGNLLNAITLFDKALPLTKSVREAAHILSLKIAAQTQHTVSSCLGSFAQ